MIFEIIDFYHRRKKTFIGLTVIIAAIIGIMVSRCFKRYSYPHELLEIDSICDINPDEASNKIKTYKKENESINGEKEWFLRFLTLKSMVKANKTISNANETNAIIIHYENGGDKSLLPQVYYCAGCAYNSLMDIPQANKYFFKGIESSSNYTDKHLLGLSFYQLGHNLSLQGLYNDAIKWQEKSLAINKETRDTIRCIYDYINIAWTLGNLYNPHKALELMLEAKKLAVAINDKDDLSEIDCQIAAHCLELGLIQKAKQHIDSAIKEKKSDNSELYSIALDTYTRLGDKDKIIEYSDSVMRHGNVYGKRFAYWCLTKQAINENNIRNASKYIGSYKIYADSAKKIIAAEASAKANALYYYGLRENENAKLQNENAKERIFIILLLAILIIIIVSSHGIYTKIKRQKSETEQRCKMLKEQLKKNWETSKESIEEKEREIKRIKARIQGEYNDKKTKESLETKEKELKKINDRKEFKEYCNEEIKKSEVYKLIEDILKGNRNAPFTEWEVLEKDIYKVFPNFERSLFKLGKLNTMEFNICLLTRIGLDVKEISAIACTSKSNIYSINRRLYYKKFGTYAASSKWIDFIQSIY